MHSQGSGHVGGALSVADILAVLYGKFMNVDPKNPQKEGRDRLVLSKGHAGPALYATLSLLGYFPREWLSTLNKLGTRLPSHCHMLLTPGVDMTAGSLGQGISAAVGLALGSKIAGDNASIYVIVGDGELQEGSNWEGLMYAGAKNVDNLIVFVDNNRMQIDGMTSDIVAVENLKAKFNAFNFYTQRVTGRDHAAVEAAVLKAKQSGRPSAIVVDTVKGAGVTFYQEMGPAVHSTTVDDSQYERALAELEG
jgi:transketolase